MSFTVEPIPDAQLTSRLQVLFLEVNRLCARHREQHSVGDRVVLGQVRSLIAGRTQPASWDATVCGLFLAVAEEVLRAQLLGPRSDGTISNDAAGTTVDKHLESLLYIATVCDNGVAAGTRVRVAGLWVRAQLRHAEIIEDPSAFLTSAVDALRAASFGLDEVERRAKFEMVAHFSTLVQLGQLSTGVDEVVRGWCLELLSYYDLHDELRLVAPALGLAFEEVAIGSPSSDAEPTGILVVGAHGRSHSGLWSMPESTAADQLEMSRNELVFDLLDERIEKVLRDPTAAGLQRIAMGELADLSSAFYFAAVDLWTAFWQHGQHDLLTLAQRAAHHAYASSEGDVDVEYWKRGNQLRLWMKTQLPEKILICDLPLLMTDAIRFASANGAGRVEADLREGVIEAFAGVCRGRELEGDAGGRAELLDEYRESLRTTHNAYLEQARDKATEAESAAWDYLFPTSDAEREQPSSGPVRQIRDDKDFHAVIGRGSNADTVEFVRSRREDIQQFLLQRLDVQLGPEHVIMPQGKIFNPKGTSQNQLNSQFETARNAIDAGDFSQAVTLFTRLMIRQENVTRDIATDFLAYCLAKQNDGLRARLKLTELSNHYRFVSRYWNLACCLPSDQASARLKILADGLERGPHPLLLRGVVSMSLLAGDTAQLRRWLPSMTMTEAMLLWYDAEYDTLDDAAKERHILRIGRYALEGEPAALDPLSPSLDEAAIERLIDGLLRREQRQAIDFWLSCRAITQRKRWEFWELRANFHERMSEPSEAAAAFKQELSLRLSLLESSLKKTTPAKLKSVVRTIKERSERQLIQCMTPDLKPVGQSIFDELRRFDNRNSAKLRSLRFDVLPRAVEIQEYYKSAKHPIESEERDEATEPDIEQVPKELLARTGNADSGGFAALLLTVSGECQKRLHELMDLPIVRPRLDELDAMLQAQGSEGTARALRKLLQEWDNYSREDSQAGKQGAWERSRAALADLEIQLPRELTGELTILSEPLVKALDRVTSRLPRDAKLLPQLQLEPVTGEFLETEPSLKAGEVAFRVRNLSDVGPLRVVAISAALDGDATELPLRDDLSSVSTIIEARGTAVLTLGLPPGIDLSRERAMSIAVKYELAGHEYEDKPTMLRVVARDCPPLPDASPYIHGRTIDASEIDQHFFGREAEQKQLLDSVRNGQDRFRYVEGIRRAGKSSLLQSVARAIAVQELPLIPVHLSAADTPAAGSAGTILYNILTVIASHPALRERGVSYPDETRCGANIKAAYDDFLRELAEKVPDHRVLAMMDDMQVLAETAGLARDKNYALFSGIVGILNIIRESGKPTARLVWVFAGHRAARQFRTMVPGALLWADLRPLPIDFLGEDAVGQIIRVPLNTYQVVVPDETVRRVQLHTGGHPESVQQVSEQMVRSAAGVRRWYLTPADADHAAHELASTSDDVFADTWFPVAELTEEQMKLITSLLKTTLPGGRIELFKLAAGGEVSDSFKNAADDLVARKILVSHADGNVAIKALVLDLWLRRWVGRMVGVHMHGAPAIFVDVANLTGGTGQNSIIELRTQRGEGTPGKFALRTILSRIEKYVRSVTPTMVAVRWAINYPPGSPAVHTVNDMEYFIKNVPDDLRKKGSDDIVLMEKISDVLQQYPTVTHYVLVLGDKDYRLTVERLATQGRIAHIIGREEAIADVYRIWAQRHPGQIIVKSLEELVEDARYA